jgi:hypothetical protein
MLHDRVTHIPIYELAFIWGVGPRVEEPGINLVRSFAYSAPLEDVIPDFVAHYAGVRLRDLCAESDRNIDDGVAHLCRARARHPLNKKGMSKRKASGCERRSIRGAGTHRSEATLTNDINVHIAIFVRSRSEDRCVTA